MQRNTLLVAFVLLLVAVVFRAWNVKPMADPRAGMDGPAGAAIRSLVAAINRKDLNGVKALLDDAGEFTIPSASPLPLSKAGAVNFFARHFNSTGVGATLLRFMVDATQNQAAAWYVQAAFSQPISSTSVASGWVDIAITADYSNVTRKLVGMRYLVPNPTATNATAMAETVTDFAATMTKSTVDVMPFFTRDMSSINYGYGGTSFGTACDFECTLGHMKMYNHFDDHHLMWERTIVSGNFVAAPGHYFMNGTWEGVRGFIITNAVQVFEMVGDGDMKIRRWTMYGLNGPPYPHPQ